MSGEWSAGGVVIAALICALLLATAVGIGAGLVEAWKDTQERKGKP